MADPIIDDPAEWNVICYGGRTFDRTITLLDDAGDPIDLTGFSGTAKVKTAATVADASATVSFTTADTTMDLGDAAGTIRFLLSATATAALQTATSHVDVAYEWDAQVTDGDGVSSPVVKGAFTVKAMDTR